MAVQENHGEEKHEKPRLKLASPQAKQEYGSSPDIGRICMSPLAGKSIELLRQAHWGFVQTKHFLTCWHVHAILGCLWEHAERVSSPSQATSPQQWTTQGVFGHLS